MSRTRFIISLAFLIIIFALTLFIYQRQQKQDYYTLLTMTGATPLAIDMDVPLNFVLTVDGLVKKTYRFSGSALNAYAKTRIRTQEITPGGKFTGAGIYLGIPVFNILEGIAPKKPEDAVFDQPLDMLVTFTSLSGKQSRFSYNELIMTGDQYPVTLAYDHRAVLPTTEEVLADYPYNTPCEMKAFRLVCPREPDVARYLDDVVRITLSTMDAPDNLLPRRQKKMRCVSETISCIQDGNAVTAVFENVERARKDNWVRIGHGHGYENIISAEGYNLRSFLKTNFPGCDENDFFLLVACDGYRSLFSGREIFRTDDGGMMMIADRLKGEKPAGGFMLAPVGDFFADRAMWGLAYVVRLTN